MQNDFQVYAGPLRATLRAAEKQGVRTADLLDAIALPAQALQGSDSSVPLEKWTRLRKASSRFTNDALFDLVAATEVSNGTFGQLQHLALSRSVLGEVLKDLVNYGSYISMYTRFELEQTGATVRFSKSLNVPLELAGEDHALFGFASLVNSTRLLAETHWKPMEVRLVQSKVDQSQRVADYFGAHIEYGCEKDELIVSAQNFQLPLAHGDHEVASLLQQHLEAKTRAFPEKIHIATSVKAQLAMSLREKSSGEPRISSIARAIGMSQRTLQRALAQNSTSFTRLLDDVRKELARLYVTDLRLSSEEIAERLKFCETSSFLRAFKRWYQAPPSKLRNSWGRAQSPSASSGAPPRWGQCPTPTHSLARPAPQPGGPPAPGTESSSRS